MAWAYPTAISGDYYLLGAGGTGTLGATRALRINSNNWSCDQVGSPTWAADLAAFIMHIIQCETWHPGIYHFSNEGEISWYDFANEIKRLMQSNTIVHPIPTSAYPTPAKRPAFSLLDKTKIKSVFAYNPPDWKESLQKCIHRLLAQ